jgi:hypothetical protein
LSSLKKNYFVSRWLGLPVRRNVAVLSREFRFYNSFGEV